ncbi:MAG TPA: ABC transporter permease [Pirellulales bacterium]|jgi:ABC-type antimicrobial peptide transport system permease subunit|nr:ABC transporter permease [Pirellulales bacterium]
MNIAPFALAPLDLTPAAYMRVAGFIGICAVWLIAGKIPFKYNLRNLAVRWRTTLLTALAFTLVVALLVVMLAFVNGMTQLTEQSGQPGNVIVLSDGVTDELMSNLGYADSADVALQRGVLRDERNRPLASREVYLVVNQPIAHKAPETLPPTSESTTSARGLPQFVQAAEKKRADLLAANTNGRELAAFVESTQKKTTSAAVKPSNADAVAKMLSESGAGKRRFVQVRGLEDPLMAAKVHGLALFPGGRWISDSGVVRLRLPGADHDEVAFEAVLGEGVAGELGKDRGKEQIQVGEMFDLGPRKWIVVGIMRSSGSTFGSEVWAKAALVGPEFGKPNLFTSIVLRASDAAAAERLATTMKNYKKAALQAMTETEYFSKLSATNKQFLVAIIFVTVIMSVGGVFGVMNTMFAAIAQRTRDIGVLRLMGFARWQILSSFFIESMAIAIVGGVAGCALGSLVDGWTATSVVSGGQGGGGKFVVLQLMVTTDTLGLGMLVTLLMGGLGGLLPALSAVRLTPLETLR